MAEFTLNGRTKVKTLKANFKENFGSTLRVYKSASCKGAFADDEATLASIRAEGFKGGDLVVKGNMQVGNFEKKVAELYQSISEPRKNLFVAKMHRSGLTA